MACNGPAPQEKRLWGVPGKSVWSTGISAHPDGTVWVTGFSDGISAHPDGTVSVTNGFSGDGEEYSTPNAFVVAFTYTGGKIAEISCLATTNIAKTSAIAVDSYNVAWIVGHAYGPAQVQTSPLRSDDDPEYYEGDDTGGQWHALSGCYG